MNNLETLKVILAGKPKRLAYVESVTSLCACKCNQINNAELTGELKNYLIRLVCNDAIKQLDKSALIGKELTFMKNVIVSIKRNKTQRRVKAVKSTTEPK
jgi:hypothetical protein